MVIIDLKEITSGLGAHFDKGMLDNYYGWCDCGCQINQDVDMCPDCGAKIVWRSSKVWTEKYLKAATHPKRMWLFRQTGTTFRTGEEYHAWMDALRTLDFEQIKATVRSCAQKTRMGRGLMKHVLNTLALQTPTEEVSHGGITDGFRGEDNVYRG